LLLLLLCNILVVVVAGEWDGLLTTKIAFVVNIEEMDAVGVDHARMATLSSNSSLLFHPEYELTC
jgi:hypothetical protein